MMIIVVHRCIWTIGYFSPLEACTVFFSIMKTSPHVRSRLGLLGLLSKFHCVFSNMDLTLTSGKQPGATAIAYIIWGVLWTPLTYSLKGGFSCLALLGSLWHLERIISPNGVVSLNMHRHIICNFREVNSRTLYDIFQKFPPRLF